MYHIFLEMPKNSDKILGVNGEELYLTPQMIRDLLHLNLKNDQVLRKFAESLQIIDDYLVKKNALFFYYQCWDKHSIYPESVPNYFTPKGEFSKTDKMMEAIELYSNIEVISPKKELIDAKRYMRTYPVTGDVSHWSQKGAYIGYLKLINKINEKSETQYQVLREDDFIVLKEIYSKNIFLKKKNGELTQQKLTADSFNKRHLFFTNDKVENRTRLLIIGDSYFRPVVEMLSESFYEVILVSGDSLHDLKTILDLYNADIVVIEAAERVDRVGGIIKGSERLE